MELQRYDGLQFVNMSCYPWFANRQQQPCVCTKTSSDQQDLAYILPPHDSLSRLQTLLFFYLRKKNGKDGKLHGAKG
jgi:hypothetical protein